MSPNFAAWPPARLRYPWMNSPTESFNRHSAPERGPRGARRLKLLPCSFQTVPEMVGIRAEEGEAEAERGLIMRLSSVDLRPRINRTPRMHSPISTPTRNARIVSPESAFSTGRSLRVSIARSVMGKMLPDTRRSLQWPIWLDSYLQDADDKGLSEPECAGTARYSS
jgi:hypothetical protein